MSTREPPHSSSESLDSRLQDLTDKQVEVLELLSMHKTSKEIGREIGISPNTVDQRLNAVRDKWGTPNRKETVRLYLALKETCGQTIYQNSLVGLGDEWREMASDDPRPAFGLPQSAEMRGANFGEVRTRVLLDRFDARFGFIGRIGAVISLALLTAITLVLVLVIADVMGRFLTDNI